MSFEFAGERIDSRIAAARRLDSLGMTEFNFSFDESLEFALGEWISVGELKAFLESAVNAAPMSFGDVYAQVGPSMTRP